MSKGLKGDRVTVRGNGLLVEGLQVGQQAELLVQPRGAKGELQVQITPPEGKEPLPVQLVKRDASDLEVRFVPTSAGLHELRVTFGGVPAAASAFLESPFLVFVRGPAEKTPRRVLHEQQGSGRSDVVLVGAGVRHCYVKMPALFSIDTLGQKRNLEISIARDNRREELDFQVEQRAPDSFDISYTPTNTGRYLIEIESSGVPIPQSPVVVQADLPPRDLRSAANRTLVRCSGPGVALDGPRAFLATRFTLSLSTDAAAKLTDEQRAAFCAENANDVVDVYCYDVGDGGRPLVVLQRELPAPNWGLECEYTPRSTARHVLYVLYKGLNVPGSPFRIMPKKQTGAEKLRASGDGLAAATCNAWTEFLVNYSALAPADLEFDARQLRLEFLKAGHAVPAADVDIRFETVEGGARGGAESPGVKALRVLYCVNADGALALAVRYAEEHLPGSPFALRVAEEPADADDPGVPFTSDL